MDGMPHRVTCGVGMLTTSRMEAKRLVAKTNETNANVRKETDDFVSLVWELNGSDFQCKGIEDRDQQ
eukprot:1083565-Amphidinium_carterae.3